MRKPERNSGMDQTERLTEYVLNEKFENAGETTQQKLKTALRDIIACTIAGTQTPAAKIALKVARVHWGKGRSTVFLEREGLSPMGAAFVNAVMANALDLDDGHRLTKGHPGAVIFPAVLAAAEEREANGRQFLDALLAAYEVSIRAGILAHGLRPEYHCTGSWGAIGAAAGAGKLLGLTSEQLAHAMGIAEYHSTYSPMMRCIDVPAMVKDGIGWGCMTGISSAYLAEQGFTGIPSLFSFPRAQALLEDLGTLYQVERLYYKPHACCRWAQPAVEALRQLKERHPFSPSGVRRMVIHTFAESARLQHTPPKNTEEAQYHLFFPAACYLVYGEVGPEQVLRRLDDPLVLRTMEKCSVTVEDELNAAFPAKALSWVEVELEDGRVLKSPTCQAAGDYDYPLSEEELRAKYFRLTEPLIGREHASRLQDMIENLEELDHIRSLTEMLTIAQGRTMANAGSAD